ncbi:MAG: NAD(P)/FAD-dependent oxidoreductase [Alphaproteobacteria bacterium]
MTSKSIAVVGSGISGLSAAWLLSKSHDVTIFEKNNRPGGHSNTFTVDEGGVPVPVDTGFIVYNVSAYPNLVALFDHLKVDTYETSMGFAVSMGRGAYEYSGNGAASLVGQWRNLLSAGHWSLMRDLVRFFREASAMDVAQLPPDLTLGAFLAQRGYSQWFAERHILPMAAAIWSTPTAQVMDFPVASFVNFFANHQLLQLVNRPYWRTVKGGSQVYVRKVLDDFRGEVELGAGVEGITRCGNGVEVHFNGRSRQFDGVVMASHADETLGLLRDADPLEKQLLGSFRYSPNRAVLHRDAGVMPRRRRLWSAWNYLSASPESTDDLFVTYWMNKLQDLNTTRDYFVSLNPTVEPRDILASIDYTHPVFDGKANAARARLWEIQWRSLVWFCGSYFGFGFHEDGIQSGLAAAEAVGGVRRPWSVANESGRIFLGPASVAPALAA